MTSSKFMKDNINISRFSTVLLLTVCIISAKFLFARTDVSSQTEAAEDGASEVYSRLYSEFAKYPHRLAGSENLENCFKAIEREFESAGIEPRRQTFMTLVQETEYCKFSYDGVQLDDVYITDNGPAPFVMDKPISCPVVYIGNGTIKEIDGKDLKGAIAVVDATLPEASLRDALMTGAKAIIIVGDATLDQWRMTRLDYKTASLIPRLYTSRKNAEKVGLLEADGRKIGEIDGRAILKDRETSNLWFHIPGKKGWTGNLNREEVLILSSRLDTYGFIPEFSPDMRYAANAALLADVAIELAKKGEMNRHVIVVFFGAHYAAQEGARYLYHSIDMSDKTVNPIDFTIRSERYQRELDRIEEYLKVAHNENVIGLSTTVGRELQQRLKKELISAVGEQREPMGYLRLELAGLEDKLDKGMVSDRSAAEARIKELNAEIEAHNDDRAYWNGLRMQLTKGVFLKDDPVNVDWYNRMMATVVARLDVRKRELEQIIADNSTWLELAEVFMDRSLVAHFDFDFSDSVSPWTLSMINSYGMFRSTPIDTGQYLSHLNGISDIYYGSAESGSPGIAEGKDWKAMLFKETLTPTYKPFSLSVPSQRSVPSTAGVGLGYAGFQMMTVGNILAHDALPFYDEADLSDLKDQMIDLCGELGNSILISLSPVYNRDVVESRLTYTEETSGYKGVNFINYAKGSSDNADIPENTFLQVSATAKPSPLLGVSHSPRARVYGNGYMYMPGISRDIASGWRARLYGIGYGERGELERVSVKQDAEGGIKNTPIHMFYAYGGVTLNRGYAADPSGNPIYKPRVLMAIKDSVHKTALDMSLADNRVSEFFADRPDNIKSVGGSGEMILGSIAPVSDEVTDEMVEAAMGYGIPLEANYLMNFDGIAQGANDAYILNEVRLRILRNRNIIRDDLEQLHGDAKDHMDEARQMQEKKKWSLERAHHIFATCIENRVYGPLRGVTEDLVQAVVVLLLLNIPFAFAMERLIFGFTNIYKQISGFCLFFIGTFLILYFTHPAFALASAPTVIFLAFVIILLSIVTIMIIMGKIKQEIRAIQGLASTVHGVESDSSTTMSAILIGIAGMRNRPLKTFLTCLTVVLLTFTILVFASFTPQEGVVESYMGRGTGENRIELHKLSFLEIDDMLSTSIDLLHADEFDTYRRGGVLRLPTRHVDTGNTPLSPDRVLYSPRKQKTTTIRAVMGLEEGEFGRSEVMQRIAPDFGETNFEFPPIYLPPIVAEALDAEVGEKLILNGRNFSFAGTFNVNAMQSQNTLDGLHIMPPDFQATMSRRGGSPTAGASAQQFEDMSGGSFEWLSADVIALARISDLDELFPESNISNFITLYPKSDTVNMENAARKLAQVFRGAVLVKSPEGVKRMFFTKAVEGSGFADVIVPLLLGGLIIFSSLMGSIVDREREIFTYSALGLSPPNVGALFFAESAVYSVIGGMGGYLVSQLVAKILSELGRLGLLTPPEMNFSSLASVSTILIVMAVVMLSTIFPAWRASRSANPGVARKWKMPSPRGDNMNFVFPFTVSEVDFTGILSFVGEHFSNHSDATLGEFAAKNVKLFKMPGAKGGQDSIGIEAEISLAPFDLGIFQKFKMYSSEFEIPGIDEVVVELHRLGGTPSSWLRSNRSFVDELRKQFLLWRSLPIETIEHYRKETQQKLGDDAIGQKHVDVGI
jgi:hypothetical protein